MYNVQKYRQGENIGQPVGSFLGAIVGSANVIYYSAQKVSRLHGKELIRLLCSIIVGAALGDGVSDVLRCTGNIGEGGSILHILVVSLSGAVLAPHPCTLR
eukprot:NODE_4083_length_327_cov_44.485000_g4033_i0.p1 GENE.NODE_4083_length_327_cov_44.485000_g4033_i0~~NODE_4083_length_327_cov_44.485000_g4033_i0.p1  ORF type:complete len:101 (-),score=0.87 NODE_4083_length_327_cov_44.485000_g4033_i0:4-306(-)